MNMVFKFCRKIRDLILYIYSIQRFKNKSCFDYKHFSAFKAWGFYVYPANLVYGNYRALKVLSNGKFRTFRDFSEHGIVFSDSLQSILNINLDRIGNIYTYSDKRKSIIQKYVKEQGGNNKVYTVGPYILGARGFWSESKIAELKAKYGKILLCYPAHSITNVRNEFDLDVFIGHIEKIRMSFDTVFVCLHLLDLNGPLEDKCIEHGFKVVSNGNPHDPMFLSRQKSMMQLADMVMSNCIGTHVGYSIALGTPFYFIPQEIINISTSDEKQNTYESEEKNAKDKLCDNLSRLFGDFSFAINDEQRTFVKEIWGINEFVK